MKHISELRQDIVTGEWVVVATGRARRPIEFAKKATVGVKKAKKKDCPFEQLSPTALLVYDKKGEPFRLTGKNKTYLERNWWVETIPNKYPAFGHGTCAVERKEGPYRWQDGVGFHEVIVTRDHNRSIAEMNTREIESIIRTYRDRYLALKDDGCVEYISIFHNHGSEAGASVSHPHSQIIAIPVIPPDVGRSLRGSAEYFHREKKCVHCTMLEFELRAKRRIAYANKDFLVFAPFVSRQAFEIRIFPRRHNPEFETIGDAEITTAAYALRTALAKLSRGLRRPAYNFFIHTSPTAGGREFSHYHWHIEIIPKTAIWAGFEIGTGIEISTIAPEAATAFLKRI